MPEFNVQFPNVGRALGQAEAINASRETRALRRQQFDAQQQAATTARNQATQLAGLRERALGGDQQAARQMLVIDPAKAEAFMDAQAKALSVSREQLDDTYEDLARAGIAVQADPSKWSVLRTAVLRRNPHLTEDGLPAADADPETLSQFGDVMTALTINATEAIKRRDAQAIANRPDVSFLTGGGGTPGSTQTLAVRTDPRTGRVLGSENVGAVKTPRPTKGSGAGGGADGGRELKSADSNAIANAVAGIFNTRFSRDDATGALTFQLDTVQERRQALQIAARAEEIFRDRPEVGHRTAARLAAEEFGIIEGEESPSSRRVRPGDDPAGIGEFLEGF